MIRPRRVARSLYCVLFSFLLVACQQGPAKTEHDSFGYVVNAPLVTTNAASSVGASTQAQLLAGRIFPSAYVPGPKGQFIPNLDFVSTQLLPGTQQRAVYSISENAKYSDGTPVTCDSFLLAFVAGTTPELFQAHLPLMYQVESVLCTPGTQQATVVFKPGNGARWRQLFGPGVLVPAHAIAAKAGLSLEELNQALIDRDIERLRPVADIWNHGFELQHFDPQLQVSSGPFQIDRVGEQGEVYLSRNPSYFGEAASLEQLVLWPRDADIAAVAAAGNVQVAELASLDSTSWIKRDDPRNPFQVETEAGVLTEQLILANGGIFYDPAMRQAFAACVDQNAVAQASSSASGVSVPALTARSVRANDPVLLQFGEFNGRADADIEAARPLEGWHIRIGYYGKDERKAAMVAAMKESCAPAGIIVEDAAGDVTLNDLEKTFPNQLGEEIYIPGALDAYLLAIDPMAEFPEIPGLSTNVEHALNSERFTWEFVPTVPLSAQPRTFAYQRRLNNVIANTDLTGIGWNMDRWQEQ